MGVMDGRRTMGMQRLGPGVTPKKVVSGTPSAGVTACSTDLQCTEGCGRAAARPVRHETYGVGLIQSRN